MAVAVEGKRWKTVRLGEIAQIFSGFAFKSHDLGKEGIPVIKIANIQNRKVLKGCEDHLPRNLISPNLEKYWLQEDDFLISMTGAGSLGKVGKMRKMERRYLVNQRVAIVRSNPEIADPEFVYQVVSQETYERLLYGWGLGAGQPNVSSGQIGSLTILFPQIEIQKEIASILSAYDDLIENNLRRIKILEEMAQTLYREWFVKFRAPGHQKVTMVNSALGKIPEGWEVKRLGELIELAYGKALKEQDRIPGDVPVFGSSGVVGYHNQSLVEGPGIIVGRKGNVGSVHWTDDAFFPIDTVFYVITKLPLYYVYFNLGTQNFISGDAAVPGLNRNQAYSLPFVLPNSDLLRFFSQSVEPFFHLLNLLKNRNELLCQTRLLPLRY